jgi:hypothetical protein
VEECGAQTSLSVCLSCGHVGCRDSSSGHATAHARKTGHPVIRALPGGFTYCHLHREYFSRRSPRAPTSNPRLKTMKGTR